MAKELPKKKKIVQDVVPPSRSVRNIEVPSRSRRITDIQKEEVRPSPRKKPASKTRPEADEIALPHIHRIETPPTPVVHHEPTVEIKEIEEEETFTYEYNEPPHKKSRKLLYTAIVFFFFAFAFGISAMFKSADIRIQPRHDSQEFNETFTAAKDDSGSGLGFQIVTVSKDTEATVEATGSQPVEKKATGQIVIYNNYSDTPQKLVATTRFQTPEGLIFRLAQAVTVPGKQKATAGHVEATVVADAAGSQYNVGLKDFTIPGFKGDPRYTQIYGRSKTPMIGGASGTQKVVSTDTLGTTEKQLEASLRDSLVRDIVTQIPANFVMYQNGLQYSFDPVEQVPVGDSDAGSADSAVLRKKGSVTAIIFDKATLSRAIVDRVLATTTPDTVIVTNLDSFAFSYATSTDVNVSSSLTFTLRGTADFLWTLDENKLKSELLGLSKDQAQTVIKHYPSIAESWITTRPFWNSSVPLDPKKVTLVNTLESLSHN